MQFGTTEVAHKHTAKEKAVTVHRWGQGEGTRGGRLCILGLQHVRGWETLEESKDIVCN